MGKRNRAARAPRAARRAAAGLAAVVQRDTRVSAARAARRKARLPRLPASKTIGATDTRPDVIAAYLERAPTATEFAHRLALVIRRLTNAELYGLRTRLRCDPIRPVGPPPRARNYAGSDIRGGYEITLRLGGGLDPLELASSPVASALARAADRVARTLGPEFWSSHFREIDNVAKSLRYYWGIRLTATEDPLTPSQGGESAHYTAVAREGTAESISQYDSDLHGAPLNPLREGALNRYLGFARNVAALHPNETALYVRLYLIVPEDKDVVYQLYRQRVKRIMGTAKSSKSTKRGKR